MTTTSDNGFADLDLWEIGNGPIKVWRAKKMEKQYDEMKEIANKLLFLAVLFTLPLIICVFIGEKPTYTIKVYEQTKHYRVEPIQIKGIYIEYEFQTITQLPPPLLPLTE